MYSIFDRWKGENVATAEVESVIMGIIGLKDAAVYGVQVTFLFLINFELHCSIFNTF